MNATVPVRGGQREYMVAQIRIRNWADEGMKKAELAQISSCNAVLGVHDDDDDDDKGKAVPPAVQALEERIRRKDKPT